MLGVLILLFTQTDTVYNLRDFRLPEVGVMRLELIGGLDFNWRDEYLNSEIEDAYDRRSKRNDFSNRFQLGWDLNINGEKRFLHIGLYPDLMSNFYGYLWQTEPDSINTGKDFDLSAGGMGTFYGGWYVDESPWFLGVRSYLTAHGGIRYNDYYDEINPLWSVPRIEVLVGGGLGKVRNVGPAARSWLFLEENGKASYDNIDALGQLLGKEWKYKLTYWRHHKFFYQDVENLLVEENVIDRLSPYQAMRLREILDNPSQFNRISGTRISIFAGVSFNSYRRDNDELEPQINVSILGGCPISRRWQVSYSSQNTVYLPLYYYLSEYRPDYVSRLQISFSHYIGDSWMLTSGFDGDLEAYYLVEDYDYFLLLSVIPVEITLYLDNNLDLNIKPRYSLEMSEHFSRTIQVHHFGLDANLTWRLR